jgi:hypothetical protein
MYEKCRKEERGFNDCIFTKLVFVFDIGASKDDSRYTRRSDPNSFEAISCLYIGFIIKRDGSAPLAYIHTL